MADNLLSEQEILKALNYLGEPTTIVQSAQGNVQAAGQGPAPTPAAATVPGSGVSTTRGTPQRLRTSSSKGGINPLDALGTGKKLVEFLRTLGIGQTDLGATSLSDALIGVEGAGEGAGTLTSKEGSLGLTVSTPPDSGSTASQIAALMNRLQNPADAPALEVLINAIGPGGVTGLSDDALRSTLASIQFERGLADFAPEAAGAAIPGVAASASNLVGASSGLGLLSSILGLLGSATGNRGLSAASLPVGVGAGLTTLAGAVAGALSPAAGAIGGVGALIPIILSEVLGGPAEERAHDIAVFQDSVKAFGPEFQEIKNAANIAKNGIPETISTPDLINRYIRMSGAARAALDARGLQSSPGEHGHRVPENIRDALPAVNTFGQAITSDLGQVMNMLRQRGVNLDTMTPQDFMNLNITPPQGGFVPEGEGGIFRSLFRQEAREAAEGGGAPQPDIPTGATLTPNDLNFYNLLNTFGASPEQFSAFFGPRAEQIRGLGEAVRAYPAIPGTTFTPSEAHSGAENLLQQSLFDRTQQAFQAVQALPGSPFGNLFAQSLLGPVPPPIQVPAVALQPASVPIRPGLMGGGGFGAQLTREQLEELIAQGVIQ